MNRRVFLHTASTLAAASTLPAVFAASGSNGTPKTRARKFTLALTPGSIGVSVSHQKELIDLAHRHRFESVEPRAEELASMSKDQVAATLGDLKAKNLVWSATGLSVDFRKDDKTFVDG